MDRPPSRRNRSALGGGGSSSVRPSGRGRRRPPRSSSTISSNSTPPNNNNNNTTPSTTPTRPRTSRAKNRHRRRPPPQTPPQPQVVLKVIVRRLPPTLSADDFAKEANSRGADRAVWRAYRPGSLANIGTLKRTTHVVRHSVAYLAFSDIQHAIDFHNQFTGFKFVETNNNSNPPLIGSSSPLNSSTAITPAARPRPNTEYIAKVERAIWQATPPITRKRTPTNNTQGTIESDPDYIAFCEKLQADGRGEDARKSSMSVAQTSALFSTGRKQSAAGSSDHSTPISLDDRNKAKVSTITSPANSNGKSNIVTPLMEDVRARRKERDQKKKPPKSTPRAIRGKGRSSAIDSQKTVPETPTKNSARKKKRRGNEGSNGDKRNDDANHQDNRSRTPKPPPASFRENSNVKLDNHVVGNESNNSYSNMNASSHNHSPNPTSGRSNGRNPSNRSRYGRSPRARGKFSPNRNAVTSPRNEIPPSPSASHNSVRLLKKEASATGKT